MNTHALAVLEVEAVLACVASRAAGAPARDRILGLRPDTEARRIRAELERVHEAMAFLELREGWAAPAYPDVRETLDTLAVAGTVLDPADLLALRRLLEAARLLGEGLGEAREDAVPHLVRLRERLPAHEALELRLDRIVDEDARIRDGASPALRALRRELREARGRLVRRLEAYLAGLPERLRVEGASISIRDGHWVIPVRREGKGEVGGVVLGESATGATLFIEPPLALELRAELQALERDEEREVRRILAEATGWLRDVRAGLMEGFEAQVDFDTLQARARTARSWRATPPEILDAGAPPRIHQARHPLLVEQGIDVVPFSLELLPDERAVVISGPNTGGKTVFLKAMGLLPLLAQSGIVPPVGPGTRLPVFEEVFADIGDEQSLAASLSTFSAHLENLKEILAGAGPASLVLVDEMGTGTDPSEGAAIARAVLEALVERGARTLVTSHLGALKELDREGSGIVNASLRFDAQRIVPTYQLEKGRPGRSYGIAISRRLGLPSEILDRAEGYVDAGERRVEALLASLEARESALERALAEAEADRARVRQLREASEAREARLEARERGAEARAREEARRLLLEARKEVEAAIREVRDAAGAQVDDAATEARRRVEAAAGALEDPGEGGAPRSRGRGGRSPLVAGDAVELEGGRARGIVRELSGDRVTVEVGGIRMTVPRSGVSRVEGLGREARRNRSAPPAGRWSEPDFTPSTEADLRGLRVDEVELALGRALDDAVMGGLAELRIIHGKGTGAVKARVRELLQSDRRVVEARPGGVGEGGEGVTVARFETARREGLETSGTRSSTRSEGR